ncbi:MAG: winged helix DNA-binding domain-containing protein, partial [Armatimonadetes bacterium]|nr:winged helix DNA-binding domain-containing protein [Anaerolineae bacterium]
MRRNETTFLALDAGKTLPKEEALAQLARRYFTSRGPVTLADFTYWSGLLVSEARAGFEAIKAELVTEVIDGQAYWLSPDMPEPPQRSLYLLPGFDEYVLGYKDRTAVIEAHYLDAICPGGNGVFMSTIVRDGRIIGTWKRTLKPKTVDIVFQPLQPLDAEGLGLLAEAAAEYGAFLGLRATMRTAPLTF